MHENSLGQIKDILMSLNWENDPDLSSKSDMDYLQDLIESLTSLLHSTPEDKVLLFRRGNAYLDKGKYEEAILDYSAIIGMNPSDSIPLNNRGICLRSLGDPISSYLNMFLCL